MTQNASSKKEEGGRRRKEEGGGRRRKDEGGRRKEEEGAIGRKERYKATRKRVSFNEHRCDRTEVQSVTVTVTLNYTTHCTILIPYVQAEGVPSSAM